MLSWSWPSIICSIIWLWTFVLFSLLYVSSLEYRGTKGVPFKRVLIAYWITVLFFFCLWPNMISALKLFFVQAEVFKVVISIKSKKSQIHFLSNLLNAYENKVKLQLAWLHPLVKSTIQASFLILTRKKIIIIIKMKVLFGRWV